MARRCHHITVKDEETGKPIKVYIPGCMSGVIHGEHHCICYYKTTIPQKEELKADKKLILELEKENAKLWRIIKKLGGIEINDLCNTKIKSIR